MPRSYLFLDKLVVNPDLEQADAIVCALKDYCNFIEKDENVSFLKKLKENRKKIYVSIDTYNMNESYKLLNNVDYSICDGWCIMHASCHLLNRLTIKARECEVSKKINYGTISFIASIDTPKSIVNVSKIAKYDRVDSIHLNLDEYLEFLGLDGASDDKLRFIRQRISLENDMAKKKIIDTFCEDTSLLVDDIHFGKNLGFYAKSTHLLNQVAIINQEYIPSKDEIDKAKYILQKYDEADKKQKKHFSVDGVNYSINSLVKYNMIYDRAYNMNLLEKKDYQYELKDNKFEKVKPYNIKKFYTMGEEIGNSVTHGIGVLFSIAFLVLLAVKGAMRNDTKALMAYIIFALSSIVLYLMSTLYHGLPTGSKAKALFQRFDHMTIYLLIAGTYTPFSLLALGGKWGSILCIYLWCGALIGFTLNLIFWGRFKLFHMILYVLLGWTAILFIDSIYITLGTVGTILLVVGGVMYTLGVIFYSLKLFKYTHMIWHIFVLFGTILQFLSIYLYL